MEADVTQGDDDLNDVDANAVWATTTTMTVALGDNGAQNHWKRPGKGSRWNILLPIACCLLPVARPTPQTCPALVTMPEHLATALDSVN